MGGAGGAAVLRLAKGDPRRPDLDDVAVRQGAGLDILAVNLDAAGSLDAKSGSLERFDDGVLLDYARFLDAQRAPRAAAEQGGSLAFEIDDSAG